MPNNQRFVFDTNVIVSALLLKDSTARKAFDKAILDGKILLSLELIDELYEVLQRKSFDQYLTEEDRLQFLTILVREAVLIEVNTSINECRDPNDNKILELAFSGDADCIISGDEDLLTLNPFRGIQIVTPRRYLES